MEQRRPDPEVLAALATPLVISVHSVVSWDFALGIVQVTLIVLTGRFVFGVPFTGSFAGLIRGIPSLLINHLYVGAR